MIRGPGLPQDILRLCQLPCFILEFPPMSPPLVHIQLEYSLLPPFWGPCSITLSTIFYLQNLPFLSYYFFSSIFKYIQVSAILEKRAGHSPSSTVPISARVGPPFLHRKSCPGGDWMALSVKHLAPDFWFRSWSHSLWDSALHQVLH